jgi:hypothetical protein
MNTNLPAAVEARVIAGEDRGNGHPMMLRFPDGTEKNFTVTEKNRATQMADALMGWVKGVPAAERERWITSLAGARVGSLNYLIRDLLRRQAQEEKTGKWPWRG